MIKKDKNHFIIKDEILNILLRDNTTKKNIIWATDIYKGLGYKFTDQITIETVTGIMKNLIKPRINKSKGQQLIRIKEKAEVFTPSWICNIQNNSIDEKWFGYKNVFNTPSKKSWRTKRNNIIFKNGKTWREYVSEKVLEISCGEAPYLVSRYDTVIGKKIELSKRIGILDRKLRVINENVTEENEWTEWATKAYKSVFGFEWQGDSVLIARKNLLYTYVDNYTFKFKKEPSIELLKDISEIISWNIWQMDGIKFVIPESCKNERITTFTLFGNKIDGIECYGCKKGNIQRHNGIYSKIMNWETNRAIKFITIMNRSGKNVK